MEIDNFSNSGSHIAQLFREINKILNKRLRIAFQGLGLTPSQMMILHYLSKRGECKVSDISNKYNLAPSTVSSILDRLEQNDLIVRQKKKEDRRVVKISLSEKALNVKDSIVMSMTDTMKDMTQNATDEELERVTSGLILMKEILNRNDVSGESESHY